MKEISKILIVRTDRIGDVTLTLPLASFLKRHFPRAVVSFLSREYTKAIPESCENIDETLTLVEKDGKTDFFATLDMLRKRKFDVAIVARPTFEIAMLLFLAGIRIRVGTGYRWYSFLFNRKVYEHRRRGEKHELEYNVNLLKPLGIEETVNKESVVFGIHIDEESKHKVLKYLSGNGFNPFFSTVIIHPGSGGSAIDLPLDKLKDLTNRLARELHVNIIITGSEKEKELCKEFEVNEKIINTAGVFDLKELMSLISLSKLLIANSTGPIHLAAALEKNVIGFYPPVKELSPMRWGPYTTKAAVFTPDVKTEKATVEFCIRTRCMEKIDMEKVFQKAKDFLNV